MNIARTCVLLASVATLAALPLLAQEPQPSTPEEIRLREQIKAIEKKLATDRAEGLRAVTVNGRKLPPEQVRREAIYLVGGKLVEAKMADFFIDEWKEKAIKELGRDPKEFTISDEALVKELEGTVKEFQVKNPGIEFWDAVRAMTGLDKEGYLQQRRQAELFNKVFFPGAPKNWPAITKEAIMASAQGSSGKEFWENIEKSGTDEKGNPRELPPFWMQLCRQWVQKQLKKWSDVQFPSDGLPAELVLKVNDQTWGTNEAFEMIRPALYMQDIEKAMAEVIVREALRQELEAQKAHLSDEAFRKEFDIYRQEYDNTPFNTEVIAVAFKGYPSLEAYRQRWRLMKSFENHIAKEINDDNLKVHAEKYARFFADGSTNLDVIQFLGRDIKTSGWVPFGMEEARKRCEEAFAAIKAGESFDKILETKAEFYSNDNEKGRLGSKSLNQLRQSLRESEFADLLQGYALGNWLFYDAEVGKVHGPLRGPDAWYIARINSRTPARSGVSVQDARTRELVKQDYVTTRFLQWANEVMAKAKID